MKPRLVVTVGDPAGIGPEIVAAAVQDPRVLACCDPVVLGDPVAFHRQHVRLPRCEMLPVPGLRDDYPIGRPTKEAGRSALESLRLAVGLIAGGQAQALVTAPVSKEALHLAGAKAPGHTEWLARQSGAKRVAMLMVAGPLRALLMTRHVPLAEVSRTLTRRVVDDSAELADDFVKHVLLKSRPQIVACGVNPHASDNGLIGKEEQRVLAPALRALERRGILIKGPRPADSVFREMALGRYDLALAAYHDQGMIPLKLFAPDQLVNITLGLPYVRTSPGHGTAYDIAGQGMANAKPMKEALILAAKYSACIARR
jgi:4-hydroxythreonine-4-phosphate dehydrogenase